MAFGLYDSTNHIRVTVVAGTTWTGVAAADGSANIIFDDASHTGLYHPCGAYRVNSGVGTTQYDPSGAQYSNLFLGPGIGTPNWVPNPTNPPDITINWLLNTAWTKTGGLTTPTTLGVVTSRASVKQVVDNNGNWTQVAANTTAVGNGTGRSTEEARTNSIRNNSMVGAAVGTPGVLPTNWVRSANDGLSFSVVAVGTESGINYVDVRYFGTSTGALGNNINFDGSTNDTALYGQTWTNSFFIRIAAGSTANLTSLVMQMNERTNTGAAAGVVHNSGNLTGSLGAATLGVAKTSFSATLTSSVVNFVVPEIILSYSSGVAIDITLRIGWPQLENNSLINSSVASAIVHASGGGVGYINGDTGTISTGTGTTATYTVTASTGGIVSTVSVTGGSYTVFPSNSGSGVATVATTGIGTGLLLDLTPTDNSTQGFATSPIITSGSAATRAADVTTMSLSSFTVGPAYTLFEAAIPNAPTSYPQTQGLLEFSDGTTNQRFGQRKAAGNGFPTMVSVGGTGFNQGGSIAWAQSVSGTVASSYAAGAQAITFNGAALTNTNAASLPNTPSQINFGSISVTANGLGNNLTSKDAIWLTQAIPNAQLQALT